jgi:4-amino-4-deoxy-L-arabinose transferase-like glycosyltransferase
MKQKTRLKLLRHFWTIQLVIPLFLFIIAFLLRIPMLHTEYLRTQDSVEYINIANNLASGNGFVTTMKPFLFDDRPVIIAGNHLRPMVTPFVYAGLLLIDHGYYFLQFFNILLSAVDVVLFYLLIRKFVEKKLSIMASLIIAFNPYLIIDTRFIISEQLFYFFVLTFFIVYYYVKDRPIRYILLGIIAALAYLTRSEGGLLLMPLIIINFKKPLNMTLSILLFIIVCIPNFIINYYSTGNPLFSPYGYLLSIMNYMDVQTQFYHVLPTPLSFIEHNYAAIAKIIYGINVGSIETLLNLRFLGFLSFLLALGIFKNRLLGIRLLLPIVIYSCLHYVFDTFMWSVAFQPERHLAIVYFFLILFIFVQVQRKIPLNVIYLFFGMTIAIYFAYYVHQTIWIRTDLRLSEKNDASLAWIRHHASKTDIIATHDPWTAYLFTDRPVVTLPFDFPQKINNIKVFKNYIKMYNVTYIRVSSNESDLYAYLTKEKFIKLYSSGDDAIFCASKCNHT